MSLHQLNEIIMEAMIILDPPWLPKDTRSPSSLTSQQIAQALELLLSSSHLTDIKETDEPPQRSNIDIDDDYEGGDHPMNGECHDRNNKDGTRQTISSVVEYSSNPTKHDSSTLQPSITDRKRKSTHSIYNTTSRNSTTESSHHNKSLKMLTPTHHPVALLTCFADYYRSVIVCCSLLLELCPDEQYDDNLYNTPISTNPNHDNNDRSNMNMNNNSTTINPKNTKDHQQQQQTFNPKVESLLKTIRQSILLLQRLAYSNHHNYFSSSISIHSNNMTTQEEPLQNKSITSSRYNSHYKQTQPLQQQQQHQHQLDIDWHDDYLPSSQYPLLQECFQRIELMNVQDGIVFGRDDRLVSLDCRDYYLNRSYHGGRNNDDGVADRSDFPDDDGNVRMNDENCIGANDGNYDDGRHPNENDEAGGGPMETSTDLALFCMDSKAIASEADELFDIALPTTSNNHRRKTLNPDKQQLSSILSRPTLPNSSIRQSKEEGWYQFIQNPFTGQTFPICKEGWLCMLSITLSNGHPSPTSQSCYIQLLTNNVLILTSSLPPNDGDEVKTNADRHKTNDSSNIDASPSINVITLTNACRCIPKVQKQQFQFHLENVYLLHSSSSAAAAAVAASPQHCNIEFGVDEMRGGSYLDGYSWVTTLTDAVKKSANLNDIQSQIYKEWSNGDGAKVKNDYLQAKSCVM